MYINLKIALLEKGLSIKTVANKLGLHRNTLSNKLDGNSRFYLDEIKKIRDTYFPDKTLDELSYRK